MFRDSCPDCVARKLAGCIRRFISCYWMINVCKCSVAVVNVMRILPNCFSTVFVKKNISKGECVLECSCVSLTGLKVVRNSTLRGEFYIVVWY